MLATNGSVFNRTTARPGRTVCGLFGGCLHVETPTNRSHHCVSGSFQLITPTLITIIYLSQVRVDVFFIDWERPRGKVSFELNF